MAKVASTNIAILIVLVVLVAYGLRVANEESRTFVGLQTIPVGPTAAVDGDTGQLLPPPPPSPPQTPPPPPPLQAAPAALPPYLAAQKHALDPQHRQKPFPPFQQGQPWWNEVTNEQERAIFERLQRRRETIRTDKVLINNHANTGFNNQRMSFTYGLILSILLNRTFAPQAFIGWPARGHPVPAEQIFDIPNLRKVARIADKPGNPRTTPRTNVLGFRDFGMIKLSAWKAANAHLYEVDTILAPIAWGYFFASIEFDGPEGEEIKLALKFIRYHSSISDMAQRFMAAIGGHYHSVHMRVGDHVPTPNVKCDETLGLRVDKASFCRRPPPGNEVVTMQEYVMTSLLPGDLLYIATNKESDPQVTRLRQAAAARGARTITMNDVVREHPDLKPGLDRLTTAIFPSALGMVDQLVTAGSDTFFATCPSTLSSFSLYIRLWAGQPFAERDVANLEAYVRARNVLRDKGRRYRGRG
eukprot:m.486940 g.486940  ORF g.486940 m.486940 type:complete len:472 (-) comp24692_c0_seq1:386-1801(-)